MVVYVYQMVLEVLLVNVHLDTVVNDVKIEMVVPVNHVKIMVFASIQVVVHIHVNVRQVMTDQLANNVYQFKNLRMIVYFYFS
jgi:hypothetical protein